MMSDETPLSFCDLVKSAQETAGDMIDVYNRDKDDTDCIKDSFDDEKYITVYYGNVLDLNPSGKYYMPWCSNQTEEDVDNDTIFWEEVESVLSASDLWVESGEGNALDIFVCGAYEEPLYTHVSDIPDDYQLITDSQDIKALCESIGLDYWEYGDGCFFVLIGDGEYTSVYYCDYSVPCLDYNVERINLL